MRVLILAALLLAAAVPAEAATWRITKDHWSEADERGFGAFVTALGESGCNSSQSCLRSAANPWRHTDAGFLDVDADCAKLPYLLRGYYAWKNGLPFSYAQVRGERFSACGNDVVGRTDIIDRGDGIDANRALRRMMETVFSGTFRVDPGSPYGKPSDFYSPAIQPGSIRSGTVIYDTNGHVGIVYKVDESGRIHYMDAHPDFTITRSVYGAQFGRSPMALGGGLKNWRPLQLVGARWNGGSLVGGAITVTRQAAIPDFSLVQYSGTDGQGRFAYRGASLGYYEYVRVAVSGGRADFNPVYELQAGMRTLCNDLGDRAQAVNQAVANGISARPHPGRLPRDIYLSDDGEWEAYATPARDARLRAAFLQLRADLSRMIGLWLQRDPRIVHDGLFLKDDLLAAYDAQSAACRITYLTSDKRPVTLDFDALARRLPALSFDPYHCEELRWGDAAAASCNDSEATRRFYAIEAPMRAEVGRDQPGSEVRSVSAADFDLRGMIAAMPARTPFVQRLPGQG